MLEWGSPLWFLALPLAVLLPWRTRGYAVTYSALGAVRTRRTARQTLAALPKVLGSIGLALWVVALARPQQVDREQVVESDGVDIVLALDTSGSMEQADYTVDGRRANRLMVAKEVMAAFIEGRPHDRLGLVVFGETAFTQVPLTLDHDALVGFLNQVQLGMAGDRATAIGDGLAIATNRLKDLDAPSKVVILLTDGRNNAGQISPIQAAQAAAALGVRVYTIGVGGGGGGQAGFMGLFGGGGSDLDEKSLGAIAKLTGGQYFRAQNTNALEEVYKTIDTLEKSTAEVKEYVHREEIYHRYLGLGILALLLQALLGETVLRRLP